MHKQILIVLGALLASAALAVGCGGGGSSNSGNGASSASSSTSSSESEGASGGEGGAESQEGTEGEATEAESAPPAGTKAAFVDEANEACAERLKQAEAKIHIFGPQAKSKSPEGLAKLMVENAVTPTLEAEIKDIRGLEVPAGDSQQVDAIVTSMQKAIAEAEQDPLTFARREKPFAESEKPADAYGLVNCGRL
jgi:hypothetical protein